ncbi:MAG: hypothetical protein WCS43_14030 [Verrucomicrobiota bacterium]
MRTISKRLDDLEQIQGVERATKTASAEQFTTGNTANNTSIS